MEATLVGEKTIAFSIAHEILITSVNIPTIPANGRKIIDMVRQPEDQIDIPSFVKLVESDPGLFMRIVQLSNSTFYSEMDKIVSLRAAITRIGLVDTVNTVCLHFFQKMLPKFPDIEGFSYNDFWSHSWICAVANRRLGHPNLEMDVLPGDLYMTGMLQGLGKLLLAIHFPHEFSKCIKKARDLKQSLHKVERDIFGTTDTLVASKVLNSWNFPAVLCEGVAFSQTPELAPPEYILIAGLTQFAYGIAGKSGIGCSGDGIKMELPATFLGQRPNLKFSKENVQESLVKEVVNSMKDKVADVTQAPENSRPKRQDLKKPASRSLQSPSDPINKSKKGLLGWAKSLWGGN